MYLLARLFMVVACLATWLAVVELVLLAWPISVLFVIGVLIRKSRLRRRLSTLGSARWANKGDLRSAGMLDGGNGLILGRLVIEGEEG
jgi:type IV secretory pathway TraG/TraD family ATPase VirD4